MFQPNDDPIAILPLFKKTASTDWFENSEMQFQLRNAMCKTRFYHVIISLLLDIVSNLSLKVQRGTDYYALKAELLSMFKQTKPEQFQEKEPFKINSNLMNVNKIEERQPPEESNKIKVVLSKNEDKNGIQQSQQQNAEQNATIPSANSHMDDSLLPVLSLPSPVQQQQQQDHHRKRKAEHSSSSSRTSHSRNRLQLDRRLHERPEQNLNQQQKRANHGANGQTKKKFTNSTIIKTSISNPDEITHKQHFFTPAVGKLIRRAEVASIGSPLFEIQQNQQHQTQNLLEHQKRQQHQTQQQHKKQDRRQPHLNQQPNTPEKGGE
ncbi:hypothetical protein HELRODRAFT_183561 [Helobdella robusta]|uniref:Uncharacterized protein n=1 Tax=Helobdella robusta TaxID=6412 RepID=T1FJU8_HELRO|nr:hypothetical protein HELRODRAFT_183561 [Helobdella robusta]ESO10529.1 hypothetical protein HELRODRAFT_183561 [Helobdella robusta]